MFLYGMHVMAEGTQKSVGNKMKDFLGMLTSNRLKAVLVGTLITGIIQSSGATTVMVVGFVSAGLMTLSQAVGVIMGANIGTTVTAWIVSLSQIGDSMKMLNPEFYAPVLIGIGAGIIDGCLAEIAASNAGSETNDFLDNGYDELNNRFQTALSRTIELADAAYRNEPELLETLRLREAAAWLCLDAAQSAALHTGAAGYLMSSPVQRRVREAMFVAIVTPAIKHLRKEISELEFIGEGEFSI